MLTFLQAQSELGKIIAGNYTTTDLIRLAEQVVVDTMPGETQGAITLLYSGDINGVKSEVYIADLIRQNANIRVIDKTQAGKFLSSPEFNDAFKKIATKADWDNLYNATEGPWAKASARFVAETTGDIRFLGPLANFGRQFGQTELKAIINGLTGITSIEGFSINELKAMGLDNAFSAIKVRSAWNAGLSGFKVVANNGNLVSVTIGDFLKPAILDSKSYILSHPDSIGKFVKFLSDSLASGERTLLKGLASNVCRKLGPLGAMVSLGFAVSDSAEAANNGDTTKAARIMEHWAVDMAGSELGSIVVGGALVAIVAGAAALAGATISAPVLAALAIGGAVIGGIYGADAATEAWESIRGSGSELDFQKKISNVVSLPDFHIKFGTANGDQISGTDQNDDVYAGAGGDNIQGQIGNDTLRGDAGSDTLLGGQGNDSLKGGDDADSLNGGEGADSLEGGDGVDTYVFEGAYGTDQITDSDGQGSIKVDDQDLPSSAAKKVADNIYRDKASGWSFTKVNVQTDGSGDLVIQKDGSPNNSITIRHWTNGQLGINLSDTKEDAPTGMALFKGDQRALRYGIERDLPSGATSGNYAWSSSVWNPDGSLTNSKAEANFADVINGNAGADSITGLGGNDALNGNAGNDIIEGGEGDDLIGGAAGSDTLRGGAGNDQILGGLALVVPRAVSPTAPQWAPPAGEKVYAKGPTWGVYEKSEKLYIIDGSGNVPQDDKPDFIEGGAGYDRILASFGNDYVDGGDDDDSIKGLAGNDYILGGAGADVISGDATSEEGYLESTPSSLHGNDVLDGGKGNDTLMGQGGKDQLFGGDNDDKLWGDDSDIKTTELSAHDEDYLDGGLGNDQLIGGGKDDELFGGGDNDSLWGDDTQDDVDISVHGNDFLDGEDGNDQLVGGGKDDELFGGEGKDTLYGDDAQDNVAVSAHGKDYLDGEAGDDVLVGGGDNDELFGGDDNDKLWGDDTQDKVGISAHGNDYLDGENGNDQLTGGGKDDELFGGQGNDTLFGDDSQKNLAISAHGADYLDGGDNDDTLVGGGSDDTLIGGQGKDALWGDDDLAADLPASAHGNDYLDGGTEDDQLIGGGQSDTLYGGQGNDNLWGDGIQSKVAISAHGNDVLDGGEGFDYLVGGGKDDQLYGGGDDDTLIGDDSDSNVPIAAHGNDFLDGGAGNDQLFGSGGDDTLVGGEGNDWLSGEDQTSTASTAQSSAMMGNDNISGGSGNDTLLGGNGNDYLDGGEDADTLIGGDGDDTLIGGRGNNLLNGSAGNDSIVGDIGDDTLVGGEGDDTLIAGAGNNYLIGGAGNNTYVFGADSGDNTIDYSTSSAGQRDTVSIVGVSSASVTVYRLGNTALLSFAGGASSLELTNVIASQGSTSYLSGIAFANEPVWSLDALKDKLLGVSSGGDVISAFNSADNINSGAGDDTVHGADGDDVVAGGDGQDQIYGDDGNDTLVGGLGNDLLNGGAGKNTYQFDYGSGRDTITNSFNGGADVDPDVLELGASITSQDVQLARNLQDDLVLTLKGNTDILTISAFFKNVDVGGSAIGSIKLADATWDTGQIKSKVLEGTSDNDRVVGYASDDAITGGIGNDTLYGNFGNDTLNGGTGSDSLTGGGGSDTYLFDIGSGQDTIDNYRNDGSSGTTDTLLFGETIRANDISVRRASADLLLSIKSTNDTVLIKDYFWGDGSLQFVVDQIKFKDGTTWRVDDVKLLVQKPTPQNDLIEGYGNGESLSGGDGNDTINGYAGQDSLFGEAGDDLLTGGAGNDTLSGGTGKDTLYSGGNNDLLQGNEDDDVLNGSFENDTLDGGSGNDKLNGGEGNNTYLFAKGDGQDTISSVLDNHTDRLNTLQFKKGISPVDVSLQLSGNDLWVKVGTQDKITIESFAPGNDPKVATNPMQQIKFEDGNVTWGLSDITSRLSSGNDSDQYILGFSVNDAIEGRGGNDTIYAASGDDTIDGGAGLDILNGGLGSDAYLFGKGDGQDIILSNTVSGETNTLKFKAGVTPDEIRAVRADADLILSIAKTNDRITVRQFFANDNPSRGYNTIQQIAFTDSTITWDIPRISEKVLAGTDANNSLKGTLNADLINGQGGNDVLFGQAGNDTMDGGTGNDQLMGGDGNDTYRFGKGDGQDTLVRTSGLASGEINTLEFKSGLAPKDIAVSRSGNDLILSIIGTQDQVTASQFFGDDYAATARSPLQQVTFADAGYTPWSLADITAKALTGGDKNDWLTGTAGANMISGQGGADRLSGLDGHDTLDGGTGDDRLSGGAGNDTYRFGLGDGQDTIMADGEAISGKLNTLEFKTGLAAKDITFARVDNDLVLSIVNTADKITVSQFFASDDTGNTNNPIQQITFKGGDATLNLAAIVNKVLAGSTGADTITATLNADSVKGQAGDDELYGRAGNDTLDGGTGKDLLSGGVGNDTYQFGKGDGQDVIAPDYDPVVGKANTLQFKTGVAVGDVKARRVKNDLILSIANTSDQITVLQFFNGDDPKNDKNPIQQITFVDSPATPWDLTAITNKVFEGSAAADYVIGTINADAINGSNGIDLLYGQNGNDTLDGGADNDFLSGGSGIDVYKFGKGDGVDTILIDSEVVAGKLNTLTFKAGVLPGEVQARRNGNNLELSITGTADKVIVSQFFNGDDPSNANNPIQQINFTSSTETWNLATITDKALAGTPVVDKIIGTLNADSLTGGDGADVLYGQAGNDTIEGGAGNDQLSGGVGNDTYKFGKTDGQDVIGSDIDPAVGKLNTLQFKAGVAATDVFASRKGYDLILSIANSSDQVTVSNFFYNDDPANSFNPIQQVQFDGGPTWDLAKLKSLVASTTPSYTLIGTSGADLNLNGTTLADTIFGLAGGDTLRGGGGSDYLDGGADSDLLYGSDGATDNDTLIGGAGDDTLNGRGGNDTLDGGPGNDLLEGGTGSNTFLFGFGSETDSVLINRNHLVNTLQFKPGVTEQDVLVKQSGVDLIFTLVNSPNDKFYAWGFFTDNDPFGTGNTVNQVRFNDGTVWTCQDVINRALRDGPGLTTGTIYNDTLEGGLGSDSLIGGLGNNTYVYNRGDGQDIIAESADTSASKLNTLFFKGDIAPSDISAKRNGSNLELRVAGSPLPITVNSFFLNDDPANIKNPIQQIRFENGTLLDLAGIVALLPSGLSGPVMGTPGDDAIVGTTLADTILGLAGADTLTGGGGSDRLEGGADNDGLYGGNGVTDNDLLLGGSGNDTLDGRGGDDTLDGGSGNDTLQGDLGSNTFVFGFGSDSDFAFAKPGRLNNTLQFKAGVTADDVIVTQSGVDAIFSLIGSPFDKFYAWKFFTNNDPLSSGSISLVRFDDGSTWSVQDVVNKALQGSAASNTLIGTTQGDIITGNGGNDTINGGLGNNTYVFGRGDGQDTIQAFDDASPGKVNTLIFKDDISPGDVLAGDYGAGDLVLAIDGTNDRIMINGFFLNNDPTNSKNPLQQIQFANGTTWDIATITALSRSYVQTGGAGHDEVYGNDLPDRFSGLAGNDTLLGRGNSDQLFGGADSDALYGGDDNDWLYGEDGADFLDGGAGADVMRGGSDDDSYIVDNPADQVIESADGSSYGGIDNVMSSVSYSLPDNVEVLQLMGTAALDATGNALGNHLFGNVGNNHLYGQDGADFLSGEAGADTLDGGAGADTLKGGAGDDVYYIDGAIDLVIESVESGRDTVRTTQDYIAPDNVELLIAMGADDLTIQANNNGTQLVGNTGNNLILGGSGTDRLSGGGGFDTLQGGAGNDFYFVTNSSTRIVETIDGGLNDQAVVYIDNYVIADNLDRVTLITSTPITCYGNDRKNIIVGNFNGNYLFGGGSGDLLSGGGGNDTLRGGTSMDLLNGEAGDDLYVMGRGDGMDIISNNDASGNDTLLFEGVDESQLWFKQSGNDLTVSIIGTADGARLSLWFAGQDRQVDNIKVGTTGKSLSASKVATLVQAMSTMTPPTSGQTTLPANYQERLNAVIAANWV